MGYVWQLVYDVLAFGEREWYRNRNLIASNHLDQVLTDSRRGNCHGDHIRRTEDGPSRCAQRLLGGEGDPDSLFYETP